MTAGLPYTLFILLLVLAHFLLRMALGLGAGVPDLLTVALLLAARRLAGGAAAGLGFVLGLIQDAVALVGFGATTLIYTVLGYLGARSRDLFVGDSLIFTGVYLFVGKWVYDAVHHMLVGRALAVTGFERLALQAPLAALYAAIVGMALLGMYRWLTGELTWR